MSDSPGDKPFEPTEHRLREARKRGEVPQTQDLPTVAAALLTCLTLWMLSSWMLGKGWALLDDLLAVAFQASGSPALMMAAVRQTALLILQAVLPLLLVAGIAGTLVKFLLVGPVFSAKPVTPDFKRLDPVSGLKKLVSAPTWVQLAKSLLATALVLGILAPWTMSRIRDAAGLSGTAQVLILGFRWCLTAILIGLLILLAIALFDVFYQRSAFRRRMRMSHKELVDEYKQLEGSPQIKAERKAAHRRAAN